MKTCGMRIRPSVRANAGNRNIVSSRRGSLQSIFRAALLLALLLPQAAQSQGPASCADNSQDCKAARPERHVATTLDYWRAALALPVEQRIGVASPEVIDYVTQDNIKNKIPDRPRIPRLAPDFLRDVQQAFDELPVTIKQLISKKLAGIMLAEGIGGTGFSEEIVGVGSNPAAAFILLDSTLLRAQTANAWATWKENTPFKAQAGYELVAEIEAKSDDNRKNAIQYILLHELGHVLSIGEKLHPSWTIKPDELQSPADFPYFSLSWTAQKQGSAYATLFDASFPQRKDIVYYFGAKLAGEQMIGVYNALEATNLPTLYAVNHPADDWAEAFVTYVHTVLMGKPFRIQLYRDGKLAKEFKSCWSERRCEQKKAIIERLLSAR